MFCAAYERRLKEAAAASAPLSVELRQHLHACARCAVEWEQEQALLAMIDVTLREAVNTDLPGSLIAGMRRRVAELEPRATWWKPALTFAATLIMAAIGVRLIYLNSRPSVNREANHPVTAATSLAPRSVAPDSSEEEGRNAVASAVKSAAKGAFAARRKKHEIANDRPLSEPQILASPAEMAGLQQYMRRLRTKMVQGPALEQAREQAKNEEPFAIRDVEFAEIDLGVVTIAPLDGAK